MLNMDEFTAAEYRRGLVDMAGECGFERTEAGVNHAIDNCKFFPTLAEIRNFIPAPTKQVAHCNPQCLDCGGTGWKRGEDRRVSRCPCRQITEVSA